MKIPFTLGVLFLACVLLAETTHGLRAEKKDEKMEGIVEERAAGSWRRHLGLVITNLTFQQPFSSFFVMVHNSHARRLYRQGDKASPELAVLAEDGNPNKLVQYYKKNNRGVGAVFRVDGPLMSGKRIYIPVTISSTYPLVTVATMAINTNDCFQSVNGVAVQIGDVFDLPGIDAGTEKNNELCTFIPGPACAKGGPNKRDTPGEGFVHIHRGFHGINEGIQLANPADNGANGKPLSAVGYDWRNPMMRVAVYGRSNDEFSVEEA